MKMIIETRNNMTDQWQQERAHFPLLQQKTYLAAASTGLVPDYIYRAMRDYQDSRYLVGGDLSWNGMTTLEMMDWSKQMLADMLGAKKENIAFGDNSSRMLNLFTGGLDWQKGDQVLLSADCFISDRFAWQARQDIEPVFLPTRKGMLLPEDIAAAITPRTRAVSLCCAESSTGFQADLARIGALCREKGIWLCVDAVQSAGILPLDVQRMQIDFLVGNDYKWMMGFCGAGYACISDRLMQELVPWGAGWMSDTHRFDTDRKQLQLRADAGRFEMGYPNVAGIYGLGLAAEHYLALGAQNIADYVGSLYEALSEKVKASAGMRLRWEFPKQNRSGLVYLDTDCPAQALQQYLEEQNIVVDQKGDSLRISLHYFNNLEDIDRLIDAVKRYRRQEGIA